MRMVGVFGWREMELVAIAILDSQWDRPFDPISPAILNNPEYTDGLAHLRLTGWISYSQNIPSREFWERVHSR